ncbi:MAG: hypothetical protein WA761_01945 [Thermoplasmata archaeon]
MGGPAANVAIPLGLSRIAGWKGIEEIAKESRTIPARRQGAFREMMNERAFLGSKLPLLLRRLENPRVLHWERANEPRRTAL